MVVKDENLTQQKLQNVLYESYLKGQESSDLKVTDLIDYIRQRIISILSLQNNFRN